MTGSCNKGNESPAVGKYATQDKPESNVNDSFIQRPVADVLPSSCAQKITAVNDSISSDSIARIVGVTETENSATQEWTLENIPWP